MNDAVIIQSAELAQHQRGRTKAGENRLNQVYPDQAGEEQPPGADEMGEGDAEQDHAAGEDTDEGFDFHGEAGD